MAFSRTATGNIAKFRFFKEPIVWVEGSSDIQIYKRILKKYGARIESTGGKKRVKN